MLLATIKRRLKTHLSSSSDEHQPAPFWRLRDFDVVYNYLLSCYIRVGNLFCFKCHNIEKKTGELCRVYVSTDDIRPIKQMAGLHLESST